MTKRRHPRTRALVQVGAPLVAVATLALGLRVGAGEAVRAAVVFGSPPGRPAADGTTRLAWQMLTFLEDRGVKETFPMRDLVVVAWAKGQNARWAGASNVDGVAEVALDLPGVAFGDPVELEVRAGGDPTPLAAGHVAWREADGSERGAWPFSATSDGVSNIGQSGSGLGASAGSLGGEHKVASGGAVRPTVREGAIALDVVVEGDRLVAGFTTSLWVRAKPPPGISARGLVLTLAPEPGLRAERETATTCDGGWAEFPVTAEAHVVGAGILARGPSSDARDGQHADDPSNADDARALRGRWFGALPVAPGAFFVSMPRVIPAALPSTAMLLAPNPRDVVYAEVDDERGRVAAAALTLRVEPGDAIPRARFDLPPLSPGLHWLVVSGEPHGAEHLSGATVAKAFLVGGEVAGEPAIDVTSACRLGPWLAQRPAPGFPRWVALDGLRERSATNRFRRRVGLSIGLLSLLATGILETLLLVAASREARHSLVLAEHDDGSDDDARVTAQAPSGSVVTAILVAVLGLALLAVLLVAKG